MKKERLKIGGLLLGLIFFTFYFLLFTSSTASASVRPSITLTSNTSLTDGLVGWWTLDGPDTQLNILDRSQSFATGSLSLGATGNIATTSLPGRLGQGMSFDGTSDFIFTSSTLGLTDYPVTLCAWGKPASAGSIAMLSLNTSAFQDRYIFIRFSGGTASMAARDQNSGGGEQINSSLVATPVGKWSHVCGVFYSSTTRSLFVNGAYSQGAGAGGTVANLFPQGAVPLIAKKRFFDASQIFNGSIDDARIYNTALATSTIQRLYNLGATTHISTTIKSNTSLTDGLVGWWTMDGQDTTRNIADRSQSFATGSLVMGASGTLTATTSVFGRLGQALQFDGTDDRVVLPASINPAGNYTLSMWFYHIPVGSNHILFSSDAAGVTDKLDVGFPGTATYLISCPDAVAGTHCVATPAISSNAWHHLVVTKNTGSTTAIFIDGVNKTISNPSGLFGNPSGTFIGRNPGAGNFNGNIDDVRLYNYQLATATVQRLYNLGATTHISTTIKSNESLSGPNSGLVGHWTFDGQDIGSNIRDRSQSYATGSLIMGSGGTQTATTTVFGRLGQALQLDGSDDYINIPDLAAIRPGLGSWSVAYWFNASNTSQFGDIISKRDNSTFNQIRSGVGFITGGGNSTLAKKVYVMTYDSGTGVTSFHTTSDVVDGRWHHVVAIRPSSGSPLIYVDGVSMALTTDLNSGVANINNTVSWKIGWDSGAAYYNGKVDDVRVYNRALSASEVSRLYDLGK